LRSGPICFSRGHRTRRRHCAPISTICALLPTLALAQPYPAKPIKLVVPWPAGGTVDGVARVVGPRLSQALGQPVVVDNKPGAGGSLGAGEVARAAPDGYTLLLVFDTHAVNHHLYKGQGLDPFKAFEHIGQLVSSPQSLVAATNFAPNTVAELIAAAKAASGTVNYGTVGTGSSNHLNALALEGRSGIKMTHVPFKGGAPMMQSLVGGEINIMFVSAPQAIPQVKAGRIKALASGSAKRMAQLPDVPTMGETLAGFEAASWVGAVAPAGTAREIVDRLAAEIRAALADPEVRNRLVAQGFDIVGSAPAEFLAFVRAESDRLGRIIAENAVKVE